MLFETFCSCAVRVSRVDNVNNDIRTINDLVEFFPDSLTETLVENGVTNEISGPKFVIDFEIFVICRVVLIVSLVSIGNKIGKITILCESLNWSVTIFQSGPFTLRLWTESFVKALDL